MLPIASPCKHKLNRATSNNETCCQLPLPRTAANGVSARLQSITAPQNGKRRLDLADAVEALKRRSIHIAVGPARLCGHTLFHFHLRHQQLATGPCIAPKAAPGTGQRLIRLQVVWAFDLLATVNDLCCQPESPGCIYTSVMRSAKHGRPEPATPLPPDSSFQLWGHCSRPIAANQASPDGEGFDNGWPLREASRLDRILSNGSTR